MGEVAKYLLCTLGLVLGLAISFSLWIFYLFFLSYSSNNVCSFLLNLGVKDLPLHLVHRFDLSTKIRGSESEELVTLGFLEPLTVLRPL
jgi:hypothetical protein